MLSNMLAKRALLSTRPVSSRAFALNTSFLQQSVQEGSHQNWAKFFSTVKASDVSGSNTASISQLFKALSYASHSHEAENQSELYHAIDEYFRANFRKLSASDAYEILAPLAEDSDNKLTMLDDKFWVWETLDEALRPEVEKFSEDQVMTLCRALAANYKGSEDLWDNLMQRVHFYGAEPY